MTTRSPLCPPFESYGDLITVSPIPPAITAAKLPFDHRLRFVHGQGPPVELRTMKRCNGLVRSVLFHDDKPEALGPACVSICNNADRFHRSTLLERTRDVTFCRLKRQISNKQFLRHFLPNL